MRSLSLAWRAGLKTTYYLRSRSATHVEKSTLDVNRRGIQPRWMRARSASADIAIVRDEVSRGVEESQESRRRWTETATPCRGDARVARAAYGDAPRTKTTPKRSSARPASRDGPSPLAAIQRVPGPSETGEGEPTD